MPLNVPHKRPAASKGRWLQSASAAHLRNAGGTCIASLRGLIFGSNRGCSSVVERHVANVNVEGSTPFTRLNDPILIGWGFLLLIVVIDWA